MQGNHSALYGLNMDEHGQYLKETDSRYVPVHDPLFDFNAMAKAHSCRYCGTNAKHDATNCPNCGAVLN
jgi:rubrerythrin